MSAREIALFLHSSDGENARRVWAELEPWLAMKERHWKKTRAQWFRELQEARYKDFLVENKRAS